MSPEKFSLSVSTPYIGFGEADGGISNFFPACKLKFDL